MDEGDAVAHVRELAERLSKSHFDEGDERFSCSVSIGMALIKSGVGTEDILSQAVSAASQVKKNGGDGVELFRSDEQSLEKLTEDATWFMRVKKAMAEDRMQVWFQPIIAVSGEEPPISEALVRYLDETGEIVAPEKFLPAAEQFGILHRMDHLVLHRVLELMRENPLINTSVNLSARALTDTGLPELVKSLMSGNEVSGDRIHFEITETTMIQNIELAKDNIQELQDFGCRFLLDDFGKGVSSLAYLRDLPVDVIKIDGGFVENMGRDPVNRSIVRAVNDIAHEMGKKTVAEYVSSDSILAQVKEIGIDYVQGWHLFKAAPLEEFLKIGLENVKLPKA